MKTIYTSGNYTIKVDPQPSKSAVDLLHATLWGSTGPLYQHLDTPEKMNHLIGSYIFTLEKHEKAVATCTLLRRTITVSGNPIHTCYCRYFSVDPEFQGRIYGNLLLKQIKLYIEKESDTPTVFYAYVDKEHLTSNKLLKHTGFNVLRTFETKLFSRMRPRKNKAVSRLKKEDADQILPLLKRQYGQDTFVNFDYLFYQGNYFILKKDNEIVAGLQATKVKWSIKYLPGISGKIMLHLLPVLPYVSSLFNPKKFYFAAFEGVYCKRGYEKELFTLMEAACAELELRTAMIWWDQESHLKKNIEPAGEWGLMNKIASSTPAYLVGSFRNIAATEQPYFYNAPAYIAAFDLT